MKRFSRIAIGIFLVTLTGFAGVASDAPSGAVEAGCSESGPVSGTYIVTLCITDPAADATLNGIAAVSASATVTGVNPGVQKLVFYLNGEYNLMDFGFPFTFSLPTTDYVDGPTLIEAEAIMRDGLVTQRAAVPVVFANGITEPPVNTNTFTPATGTTPPPGQSFILAAAGDGAGGLPAADQVTDLIASWNPNMFLYLGDVYEKGTPAEFYNWYGTDETFYGRFRAITNPAIGNHEYENNVAPGYFDYWDNVPNYYSFNVAGWHIISLDSTNQFNQTAPGTPQYQWLEQDLNANTAVCTIVFYHHPLFNVGEEGESTRSERVCGR